MTDKKEKLWVYDTWQYFEIWAETEEKAEEQAYQIGREIGVDLRLVDNYLEYQENTNDG